MLCTSFPLWKSLVEILFGEMEIISNYCFYGEMDIISDYCFYVRLNSFRRLQIFKGAINKNCYIKWNSVLNFSVQLIRAIFYNIYWNHLVLAFCIVYANTKNVKIWISMAEYLFAYGKTNINKTNAECSGTTVTLILIKIYDPS